jgi:hypothetical protein
MRFQHFLEHLHFLEEGDHSASLAPKARYLWVERARADISFLQGVVPQHLFQFKSVFPPSHIDVDVLDIFCCLLERSGKEVFALPVAARIEPFPTVFLVFSVYSTAYRLLQPHVDRVGNVVG